MIVMNTKYIYAGTRAKTLTYSLLSETQLERLLSAKSSAEAHKVLQDTFLAPYLGVHGEKPLSLVVEESVADSKKLLAEISPDPKLLNILWIRYDFYNLRTILKGTKQELSQDKIISLCYRAGIYSPEKLYKAYKDNTLIRLDSMMAEAAEKAQEVDNVFAIDLTMDEYYFKTIQALAAASKEEFVKQYVSLHVDLFNIRSALRMLRLRDIIQREVFVSGGTVQKKDLENEDSIIAALNRVGGEKYWADAVNEYRQSGTFVAIDKAAQEYMLKFLKDSSIDVFSPAPLFAYFSAQKNNAQVIRAIVVAKEAEISESELRFVLRRLYS